MSKVAFIGLGVMGYPMAGHISQQGHDVVVYNRTSEKADAWVKAYGGAARSTPFEAAADCDFVFACVGNDDDLRSVTLGANGAFAGMKAGAVFVDNTTASAEVAEELHAEAKKRGLGFVDAPVSGGQSGAENGQLTVMCGGDTHDYEVARPVIDCYARMNTHLGGAGAGQLTKMVNQICVAGVIQGLAEGMNFGVRAGLDMDKVLSVISKGAAQSWQMENRGPTMVEGKFDFGFAVDWMRKDLSMCLTEAKNNNARLPVTALIDQFYAHVQARGGNRWDTSSLIQLLAED